MLTACVLAPLILISKTEKLNGAKTQAVNRQYKCFKFMIEILFITKLNN